MDSVTLGNTVHVFVVGTDGKVYGRDGRLGDSWTPWVKVPGGAADTKAITATTTG
ncbi:hypothetical protein [Kitasatospora sp. NPDC056531]|uniref:hypothetical protein n=1 Tax=Kitasatospora sp. NPDC056531 TaxID=3345856 RepID=UPI00367D4DFF